MADDDLPTIGPFQNIKNVSWGKRILLVCLGEVGKANEGTPAQGFAKITCAQADILTMVDGEGIIPAAIIGSGSVPGNGTVTASLLANGLMWKPDGTEIWTAGHAQKSGYQSAAVVNPAAIAADANTSLSSINGTLRVGALGGQARLFVFEFQAPPFKIYTPTFEGVGLDIQGGTQIPAAGTVVCTNDGTDKIVTWRYNMLTKKLTS